MPDLFIVKAAIVLGRRMTQGVMMRMIRLNQDATRQVAATGAAGHLRNQLEGPLSGAKIRQRQARVNRNDSDQSDIGKIMALGQHLRADEQINLTLPKIEQRLLKFAAARFCVSINSAYAHSGQTLSQKLFDLFSAFADIVDVLTRAVWTLRRRA